MRPDLKYLSSFLFAVLFIIKISCFVDIVEMTLVYITKQPVLLSRSQFFCHGQLCGRQDLGPKRRTLRKNT